ncbi:MAG: hypothetical protein WCA08_15335 [Desulfoferrobacter sp.]
MLDELVRESLKKDIQSFIPIITSPIGLDKLPDHLLTELHETMRRSVMWAKALNADILQE